MTVAGFDTYEYVRTDPSGKVYRHSCGSQILDSHIREHNDWHVASRDGSDHAPTGNDKATCEHERSDHMKAVRTGTDLTGWVPICKKCKQAYNPHWPESAGPPIDLDDIARRLRARLDAQGDGG